MGDHTGRNERVCDMRKYGHVSLFIYHVDCKPVTGFHQCVQILSRRMQFHPSRVVSRRGSINATNERQIACLTVLFVRPYLVPPHIC